MGSGDPIGVPERPWRAAGGIVSGKVAKAAATPAIAAAVAAGIPHTIHRYDGVGGGTLGYGAEAAAALSLDPTRVHKTLVVAASDDRLVVAVVAVAASLDLRSLANAVGVRRLALADPGTAERATGYVVGGISPLGQRRRLPTVVDEGALPHPTVFVSAGRRGLEIELDPRDLVRLTDATVARVAGRAQPRPSRFDGQVS